MNATATREKWTTLIQQCRSSGLTVKEWCHQNNVGLSTFYHWQKIIFSQMIVAAEGNHGSCINPGHEKPEFAELILSDTVCSDTKQQIATVRISAGTTTIELFQPLTPALLRALIQGTSHA